MKKNSGRKDVRRQAYLGRKEEGRRKMKINSWKESIAAKKTKKNKERHPGIAV